MLTLYLKSGCPFCMKVRVAAELLDIPFIERNIAEPGVAEELIARGGKRQMPYMIDSDRGVEMYESEDIVAYLNEHYTKA